MKWEPGVWGYNCVTLSLGDVNTGTWSSRLGGGGGGLDSRLTNLLHKKIIVAKSKEKTGWNLAESFKEDYGSNRSLLPMMMMMMMMMMILFVNVTHISFEVFKAIALKIVVLSCICVVGYRRFGATCYLHLQGWSVCFILSSNFCPVGTTYGAPNKGPFSSAFHALPLFFWKEQWFCRNTIFFSNFSIFHPWR
jgi:hypothetical protein